MRPACFDSQQRFHEWQSLARIAAEPVTLCDDCTPEHEQKMLLEKRCSKKTWSVVVFAEKKK